MTKQVIICVDDEKTVLKSLKTELKDALGNTYRIEIAEGGEDALELVVEWSPELLKIRGLLINIMDKPEVKEGKLRTLPMFLEGLSPD